MVERHCDNVSAQWAGSLPPAHLENTPIVLTDKADIFTDEVIVRETKIEG